MGNNCTIFLFFSSSSRGTARAEMIPLLMFRMVVVSPSSGYSFTSYSPSTTTFRGYLKEKERYFNSIQLALTFQSRYSCGSLILWIFYGVTYFSISAAKASEPDAGLNIGLPSVSMSYTSLRLQPEVRTMKLQV